jgi:hypothetical protein
MADINAHNHSAAMLVGLKQTKENEVIKHKHWLPYDLEGMDKPRASNLVVTILEELRAENKLPAAMLRDMYKARILEPEK